MQQAVKRIVAAHQGPRSNHMARALRNLQCAVSQCQDAIFITDHAGLIVRVNPAFEKLVGRSSLEIVGKDLSLITAGGAQSESYRRIWQQIFQGTKFHEMVQVQQTAKNTCELDLTITSVRDSRERIVSLVGTGRELIQLCQHESATAQTNALETMTTRLAHELSNVLLVVRAHSDLIVNSLPSEHPLGHNLREIKIASFRASELMQLLLAAGVQPHGPEPGILGPLEGDAFVIFPPPIGVSSTAMDLRKELILPLLADVPATAGGETLLIVEDERVMLESTAEFLSRAGYKVISAASAEEALEKINSSKAIIDLLVTDVVLPHMSGPQLAQTLLSKHPASQVLFVSGYAETVVFPKKPPNATRHFLQRPCSLDVVAGKIREVLAKPLHVLAASAAS